ncbi:MAG: GAF domain-containing protein [Ardenticatenaceae bacterium]|nr:GAF domain-containing protein [Ardenticatenaceae bacterium]
MDIQGDNERLQVRLFLVLLLSVMPIATLGIFIPFLLHPENIPSQIPFLLTALASFIFLGITYLFGRFLSYQASIILTTVIGLSTVLVAAYIGKPPNNLISLYYLILLILLSSLFLSPKYAIVFTAVSLLAMLTMPLYNPAVPLYDILIGPFNLILAASTANILAAHYRHQLELKRQTELTGLLNTSNQRADQLTALKEISLDILSHRDLHELLQAIARRAANLLGVPGGSIYLVNDDELTLTLTAVHGPGEPLVGSQLRVGEGMAGRVLATGQPMIVPDYDKYPGRSQSISFNVLGSVIQVPITLTNKVMGVISCQETAGNIRTFTSDDLKILQDFAQQCALAIQTAYLFQEEQAARDRAERLQAATQALSSSLILQDVLDSILEELQKVVPYDSASVQQLKNGSFLEIIGGYGFADLNKLLGAKFDLTSTNNPNRQVIETWSPVILADAPSLYGRFREPPFSETPIHSWLGVPLIFGQQIIGMLALDKREIGFYNQEHVRLASAFAAQAAVAIENARLYEETRQHAFELETLAGISTSLRTARTVPDMMAILMEKTVAAIDATFGVLFLVEPETDELISRYSEPPGFYKLGLRQPPGDGIVGRVLATREVYLSPDVANDPLLSMAPGEEESFVGTVSSIFLPLQTPDDLIGVLHIGSHKRRLFTEADVRLLTAVADIAANALKRASITDTLEERVTQRTRELAEANARLQDLDKLKTKFISDISHELRTPVATLNLYMDLLDRGKAENKAKYMDVLRQKTDQLVRLTEDILNVSRLNLYEESLQFTAVDLNDTIAIVIAMNQERAKAADLNLVFHPEPDLPPIRAERNQLLQAINNVLTNALDFTLEGSITVRTYLASATRACLEIKDTGIGIPADEIPHIFERFYRGHNIAQLNIPGTGLGLTIVKEILDLHKGTIEVESKLEAGSTFRLFWPLTKTAVDKTNTFRED